MRTTLIWIALRIAGLGICFFSFVGLITFAFWAGPPVWSQEAAGWVQALGAIIAIFVAYHLARGQHQRDRAADKVKEQREDFAAQNAQLLARFTVIRNTVQVASHSLDAALTAVTLAEQNVASWEVGAYLVKIDQLRTIVDSLVTATTEHLAVTTALEVSEVLALTHSDMLNLGGWANPQLLERCRRRVNSGYDLLMRLVALHNEVQDLCRERGIPLVIDDFRPRIQANVGAAAGE